MTREEKFVMIAINSRGKMGAKKVTNEGARTSSEHAEGFHEKLIPACRPFFAMGEIE